MSGGELVEAAVPEAVEDTVPENAVEHGAETVSAPKGKLGKLSVPELQQRYRDVVGRDTSSTSAAYLVWKIRQAEKGRIRLGPARRRHAEGEAGNFKVLPLRMHADVVARLDEARASR